MMHNVRRLITELYDIAEARGSIAIAFAIQPATFFGSSVSFTSTTPVFNLCGGNR